MRLVSLIMLMMLTLCGLARDCKQVQPEGGHRAEWYQDASGESWPSSPPYLGYTRNIEKC